MDGDLIEGLKQVNNMGNEELDQIEKLLQNTIHNAINELDIKLMEREKAATERVHNLEMDQKQSKAEVKSNCQKIEKLFSYIDESREEQKALREAVQKIATVADATKDQEARIRTVENKCNACNDKLHAVDQLKKAVNVHTKYIYMALGALAVIGAVVKFLT